MKKEIEYIESQGKFGMKLGLERIQLLLNKLGNPQKKLKFIHIAGSNGKGSVSRILESVLVANGIKTGLYSSPHLEKINERFRINKEDISDEDFNQIFKKVKQACLELEEEGYEIPTGFEIETAMAFLYFLENNTDLVILEVGLGGRLDATNVIDKALLDVITSISLEHTQWLGNTLEEIALEKSAIIKKNSNVIIAPQKETIADVIEKDALRRKAKTINKLQENKIKLKEYGPKLQVFEIDNKTYLVPLLGVYQKENFQTALAALDILKKEGYPIKSIQKGLDKLRYPGRFEIILDNPIILLDGAHNPDGLKHFVKSVKKYFGDQKIILFFGILKDKNVKESIKIIQPIISKLYLLTPNNPDALEAPELEKIVKVVDPNIKTEILTDYQEILDHINLEDKNKIYAITGSLYLIGPVRTLLEEIKNS